MAHSPEGPSARPSRSQAERILRLGQGFLGSAILRAALGLGVFDALAGRALEATVVAGAIGADLRGTRILLEGLVAARLVVRDGSTYRLSEPAESHLVPGRPGFIGERLAAYASQDLWDALGHLDEAVRQGRSPSGTSPESSRQAYWSGMARALRDSFAGGEAVAEVVASWMEDRPSFDVLDIGCGHGGVGLAVLRRQRRARLWALDWPGVLATVQERAARMGLADRVGLIAGDMFDVPLGGPYDLVILSQVLHHLSSDRCVQILRRAKAAARSDGRVVIQELVAVPSADDATVQLLSALLLAWSEGGEVYSIADYRHMLAQSDLRLVGDVRTAGSTALMVVAPADECPRGG